MTATGTTRRPTSPDSTSAARMAMNGSAGPEGSDVIADMKAKRQERAARATGVARVDPTAQLAVDLSVKLSKTDNRSPEAVRDLAQEIMGATLADLRSSLPAEQKVLAEILKTLEDDLNQVGGAFSELETYSADEEAIIGEAKKAVTSSEGHVSLAKTKMAELESAWFFKGMRTSTAQAELAKAEADLVSAKLGVANAVDQANVVREKRLLNADFSDLYAGFARRLDETFTILKDSIKAADADATRLRKEIEVAYTDKTKAAKAIKDLEAELPVALAKLEQAREECGTLLAGSPERTALEQSISDQESWIQELQGQLNVKLADFQAAERATPTLETHEKTSLALLNVHEVNLASLQALSKHWRPSFDSLLQQMRAMASVDASKKLNDVGVFINQKGAERAAKHLMGAVKTIVEMAQNHTGHLDDLLVVQETQAKGMAQLMDEMNQALQETKKRAGRAEQHLPSDNNGANGAGTDSPS